MPGEPGRLIVRADAGPEIGAGHVMRTLALAQAWMRRGGEAHFLATDLPAGLMGLLESKGVGVTVFKATRGSWDDSQELMLAASRDGADWVVLDGYAFGVSYQEALRQGGCRVMVLDDHGYADRFVADLILNQNLAADGAIYAERAPESPLLLGSRYALLRPEFSAAAQTMSRSIPARATRLLVTMGGADPCDATSFVLRALGRVDAAGLETRVVIGSSNPHAAAVLRAADACRGEVVPMQDVQDMPALISWADVAVSAAGSTSWELAALGLPSLVTSVADNQTAIAKALGRYGAAVDLGSHDDLEEDYLADQIVALLGDRQRREQMSRCGRSLVDGKGAERVVDELLRRLAGAPPKKGAA